MTPNTPPKEDSEWLEKLIDDYMTVLIEEYVESHELKHAAEKWKETKAAVLAKLAEKERLARLDELLHVSGLWYSDTERTWHPQPIDVDDRIAALRSEGEDNT